MQQAGSEQIIYTKFFLVKFGCALLRRLDEALDLMEATGIQITMDDISNFQERVGKPFASDLKNNISSRFTSQDIVSSMSIFDPRKLPNVDSPGLLGLLHMGIAQLTH